MIYVFLGVGVLLIVGSILMPKKGSGKSRSDLPKKGGKE